ncbi:tyrosine-type recombinase/integrase [Sphingosinicella microcystinivorans]|uniref:tyrosine-type recombinase/integrase n=1 Tax=Sphingosinicella microcystinivorans TaxID=335406 RepID=UPI0022F3D81B|nr:site-specific integrase [Sphingosinicella microcystinivorans]WBX85578.1 tyrosine-type recombinase/integrase [Sphingosinicella microcystinivorans]
MVVVKRPVGRPGRFDNFERFEASLSSKKTKRPAYCDGIGIYKGATVTTVWVKITLPRGGTYNGRTIPVGGPVEHKLGKRSSWDWSQLVAERDRLQGLADRGEPLEAVEVDTFAKYASEWLERKKPTMKGYGVTKGHINSALGPTFGKKALNVITIADVNRWIGKQSAKLKPATVQRQLSTFNAIMNDAVRSGVIEKNPTDRADRIKGVEPRQRFVTDEEWEVILKAVDKIEQDQEENKERTPQQIRGWLRHYVVWAYNSGMRRAEILNLTWDNVRKINGETTVIEVINTKTGKPRTVTCTEEMLTILPALRALDRVEGDNRLFPVSLTTLKRSLTGLWRATGLRDIRLHDLRRTHATLLLQRNIDPRTVAGRLGHSGTAMLAKHYAVDLGDMEAAKAFSTPIVKRKKPKEAADAIEEDGEIEAARSGDLAAPEGHAP